MGLFRYSKVQTRQQTRLLTWDKKPSHWEENEGFKDSNGGLHPSTRILVHSSRNFRVWVRYQMECEEGRGTYGERTAETGHTRF